jgi:hypothetical protein
MLPFFYWNHRKIRNERMKSELSILLQYTIFNIYNTYFSQKFFRKRRCAVKNEIENQYTALFLKMPNIIFSVMQKPIIKCVIRKRVGQFLQNRKNLLGVFKKTV